MSTCTYRINDASGKDEVITGQADMKAFLADGGLEQLLPGKVFPWNGKNADADVSTPAGQWATLPEKERYRIVQGRFNHETAARVSYSNFDELSESDRELALKALESQPLLVRAITAGVVSPSEYPTEEAAKSFNHVSHSPEIGAYVARNEFLQAVQREYDEAAPLAETAEQKAAMDSAIADFKAGYLRNDKAVMGVRSSAYSSKVAGGSKLDSKQVGKRNAALDRAAGSLSEWLQRARGSVKDAVLAARNDDQRAAERQAKDDKAAKRREQEEALIAQILGFKPGDTVMFGGYNIARVSKGRDGYPSSVTVDAKDLTDNKFDIARTLFGGDKDKLRAVVDAVRAKSSESPAVLRSDFPKTITVDGVDRPTTNSKGQPIHPTEEGVRNFWRWFGGSRVVDADGRPLVVYHGTLRDFDRFDPAADRRTRGGRSGAFYFSASPTVASAYSGTAEGRLWDEQSGRYKFVFYGAEDGGNVIPAFLSLRNPLVFDAGGAYYADVEETAFKEARQNGNDGIVFRNMGDSPGAQGSIRGYQETMYVAFRSEQIKSAIGNAGTFDGSSPDIRLRTESDLTETPAFREWFGRSKMTAKDGKPLIFMHGSPTSFDAFSSDKLGGNSAHTSAGLGHFFTRDIVTAERYADGGNIYRGWLKIERPYVMPLSEAQAFKDVNESTARRAQLQKDGFDGVLILDETGKKAWATVAFEPWQFKSTENNGNFDEFEDGFRLRDTAMRYTGDVPRADAENFIRKFVAEYPGAPSIMLVDSFDQLPKDIQKDALAQGSGPTRAKGAMKNGATYVVLNNHHSMADLQATIFHEIKGHAGIRKLLGPKFSQELNKLFVGLGGYSGLERIMTERGLGVQFHGYFDAIHQAKERDPDTWTDALATSILTEEVFAHIAEQDGNKTLMDRFKRIVGMVRDWLRRHGFAELADLGETDILFMLQKAGDGMRQGSGVVREGSHVGEKEIVDADGRPIAKESSPDYEALKTISGRLGLREREAPTVFQTAWHGSPHKFDRFSLENIGSGEGAQAYGWGLYFAGKKGVAEWYRDRLSAMEYRVNGEEPEAHLAGIVSEIYSEMHPKALLAKNRVTRTADEAINKLVETAKSNIELSSGNPGLIESNLQKIAVLESMRGKDISREKGALYQVEIPEDDEYLLWDKPLSEQPEKVRAALESGQWAHKGIVGYWMDKSAENPAYNGDDLYQRLKGAAGSDKAASEFLHSLGIAGIKYLDGTSRKDGDGSYNYVVFDDSRVDTTAVLRTMTADELANAAQPRGQMAKEVMGNVLSAFKQPTSKVFGPLHTRLSTQLHKAWVNKDYGKVFHLADSYERDISRFSANPAAAAPDLLPAFDNIRDAASRFIHGNKTAKLTEGVADALFKGTLAGEDVTEGRVWTDTELRDQFNLSDEQIKLYREARAAIDASLDATAAGLAWQSVKKYIPEFKDSVKAEPSNAETIIDAAMRRAEEELREVARYQAEVEADGAIPEGTAAKTLKKAQDVAEARKAAESIFMRSDALKEAGYAPLMRFGRFAVDVVETQEDGAEERLGFYKFETEIEAKMAAQKLQKEHPNATVTRSVMSEEAWKLFKGVDPDLVSLFADKVDGLEGLSVDNEVLQEWYRSAVNQRSAFKRMIHRKGVEGFDKDLTRVVASFITSNARVAARQFNMGDIAQAISDMQERKVSGDVVDEAVRLKEYMENPTEPFQALKGWMFAWFLGGSVASAALNLTQPLMMTLPYLSQYGAGKAAAQLTKAAKEAATNKVADEELKRALAKAAKDGKVDPQQVHHLYHEGMRPFLSKLPLGDGLRERAQGLMTMWGYMFGATENFNRRITFIAAYRMAKDDPSLGNPYDFAIKAIDETQGIYSKANRPNWARGTGPFGAIGVAAFTFKQYSIGYIELLVRMAKSGKNGRLGAAMMLGLLVMMSGIQGAPGADDLEDIIDTVSQYLGYTGNSRLAIRQKLRALLGEEAAKIVMHGGLSALPFDIAGRVGMGNLLPATAIFKPSEQNRASQFSELFGPPLSMSNQVLDAALAMESGAGVGGVANAFAPVAVRNLMKAYDMASTGEYRDSKGRKVTDVSLMDAAFKAGGLQPTVVSDEQKGARLVQMTGDRIRQVKAAINGLKARAIVENDNEMRAKADELLADWNRSNPDARIMPDGASVLRRVKEMRAERRARVMQALPREYRKVAEGEMN